METELCAAAAAGPRQARPDKTERSVKIGEESCSGWGGSQVGLGGPVKSLQSPSYERVVVNSSRSLGCVAENSERERGLRAAFCWLMLSSFPCDAGGWYLTSVPLPRDRLRTSDYEVLVLYMVHDVYTQTSSYVSVREGTTHR